MRLLSPRSRQFIWELVYIGSVATLFLIVHFTNNRIQIVLKRWTRLALFPFVTSRADFLLGHATTIKAVLFFTALLIVCIPIAIDLYRRIKTSRIADILRFGGMAIAIVLVLYALVFRPFVDAMGTNYSLLALDPFSQPSSIHNKRLLMPALAYAFFVRDFRPYYFFSVALTVLFVALLLAYLFRRTQLRAWQVLSICTCSFVLFQYQYGGYPDILVFICFILVMEEYTSPRAKLTLLILALLAHESSMFVGAILAWKYLSRKERTISALLFGLYLVIWFLSVGANVDAMLGSHNIQGMSGIEWVLKAPLNEAIGVLVAYKAIWIIFCIALYVALKNRQLSELAFMLLCVTAGIGMTLLGLDTSRLMGFAFPGVLVAVVLASNYFESTSESRTLGAIFAVNLLLPSFYIGLNGGYDFPPGLYNLMYGWVMDMII